MKTPGPDHPIAIARDPRRVRVRFQDHVIADTANALVLREADYPPVVYFPREDVETGFLSRTATSTTCPYKGVATYYSMLINGDLVEDAAWSYEDPYPAMDEIRDRLAFYPNKVEIYEVDAADIANRRHPADPARWPAAE